MTYRSAKVVTIYRGSVKKPNKLISGCEAFRENNVLLTLAQLGSKPACRVGLEGRGGRKLYLIKHGQDMPKVLNWQWTPVFGHCGLAFGLSHSQAINHVAALGKMKGNRLHAS
jgi:hypothetical protein